MEINKEYIDMEDALKRVGGNKDLLIRLLRQFIDSDFAGQLDKALEEGDLETAGRNAHSVKGTGANLSLPKLTAVSLELEQKIKGGEDYSGSLAIFKEVYAETLKQIEAAIG